MEDPLERDRDRDEDTLPVLDCLVVGTGPSTLGVHESRSTYIHLVSSFKSGGGLLIYLCIPSLM